MAKKIKNKRLRYFREHTLMENLFSFFGRKQKKNTMSAAKLCFAAKQPKNNAATLFRSDKVKRWEQTMLASYSVMSAKRKSEPTTLLKSATLQGAALYKHMTGAKQSSNALRGNFSSVPVLQKTGICGATVQNSALFATSVLSMHCLAQGAARYTSFFVGAIRAQQAKRCFAYLASTEYQRHVPQTIFDTTFDRLKLHASVQQLRTALEPRQKHGKIVSPYKNMLCESRKLRFLYGNMSKRDLFRAIAKVQAFPGTQPEGLLCFLESRLDVSLQRSGFCATINCAKQMILSNKVQVNHKKICSPGYQLKAGDVVAIQNGALLGDNKKRHVQTYVQNSANPASHALLQTGRSKQNKLTFVNGRWRFKGSPSLLSLFTFTPTKMLAFQNVRIPSNLDKQIARHVLPGKDNVSLSKTLVYLCYAFFLKKELQSLDAKNDCFKEQKKEIFFKSQYCLAQKMTKPLHLEISYKSLCIIFLYPPQRVCLPVYVDLDSILKRF